MGIFLVNPYLYFVKPWAYGGENEGFWSGGLGQPSPPARRNTIYRFPFSTDGGASAVGTLSAARQQGAGQHSDSFGYDSGGLTPPSTAGTTDVNRFRFATNQNAVSYLALTQARVDPQGASSETHGYNMGGSIPSPGTTHSVVIDRFSFATSTNATNVGSLVEAKRQGVGNVSPTHAYAAGGNRNPPIPAHTTNVQRFPFATTVNAVTVLTLATARAQMYGCSSETHGYGVGGSAGVAPTLLYARAVEKYPFATNVNASYIADILPTGMYAGTGQSSMTHGYVTQGIQSPTAAISGLRFKFPFATNAIATSLPTEPIARGQQGTGVHY